MGRVSMLSPHILPKQQNAIAVLELAIQAVADAQDGTIDYNLDVLSQFARLWIPERAL